MSKKNNNKVNIDLEIVKSLCGYQATAKEIADIFKCSISELKNEVKKQTKKTWSAFYKANSARGKVKIRENQILLCKSSPFMAKYLDQKYLSEQEKLKNKAGRPRKWQTPRELQKAVDAYFDDRDDRRKPYTITGLTLALGFNSRQSLLDYAKKEEFMDIIKTAKMKVEEYYEESLHREAHISGIIFGLKANFGWEDKTQIDHTSGGEALKLPNQIIFQSSDDGKCNNNN